MSGVQAIEGAIHLDDRGSLRFFNAFDLSFIKRMYEIRPASPDIIRAWQGHAVERKWFYCHSGSFLINLVKVDEFENPSSYLIPKQYVLESEMPCILEIPGGYASGIKALEDGSSLLVFSDLDLELSKNDDYRFPEKYWEAKWLIE